MKRISNILRSGLMVISMLTIAIACNDKLDIKPKQSIDAETALSSPENIKAALVGAYLEARGTAIFGSYFNEYSELYAATTDLQFIGTYQQPREFFRKEAAVTNSYVESTWTGAYNLINKCNLVLQPEVLNLLSDEDKTKVEGEAKFLRGWVIFEMTRLFGLPYEAGQANTQLGIPLILTPTSDVADAITVARNTVQDCYAQAISDLTSARDLLPVTNGVYANTYAASAVLARLYLQQGNYPQAATQANRVIQEGGYVLTGSPLGAFNNHGASSEDIFAFQNNVASNTSWLTVMYASLNGMGRGDYDIQQAFLDRFDPLDERGMLQEDTQSSYTIADINRMYYIGVGSILNFGGINTSKWGDYYANIPLLRIAEMYLIRAEANYESGTQVGPNTPTQDINVIRLRSKAPVYATDVTQQQIRDERYFELCWEGHRLHDLKRWKQSIGTFAYNAGNLILPIPFREMEVNDLLVQNEWYVSSK